MSLFGDLYPPAPEPTREHPECSVFAWMGQPMSSCDTCGKPVWDHLFHPPYGGAPVLFRVKQRKTYGDREWYWQKVGSLVHRAKYGFTTCPTPPVEG